MLPIDCSIQECLREITSDSIISKLNRLKCDSIEFEKRNEILVQKMYEIKSYRLKNSVKYVAIVKS